jgi:hypothetical protein
MKPARAGKLHFCRKTGYLLTLTLRNLDGKPVVVAPNSPRACFKEAHCPMQKKWPALLQAIDLFGCDLESDPEARSNQLAVVRSPERAYIIERPEG